MLIQGRLITDGDIVTVREVIERNPSWSRYWLSRELAQRRNWRKGDLGGDSKPYPTPGTTFYSQMSLFSYLYGLAQRWPFLTH